MTLPKTVYVGVRQQDPDTLYIDRKNQFWCNTKYIQVPDGWSVEGMQLFRIDEHGNKITKWETGE